MKGKVDSYDNEFGAGYIKGEDGCLYFLDADEIETDEEEVTLNAGDAVEFDEDPDRPGMMATNVRVGGGDGGKTDAGSAGSAP